MITISELQSVRDTLQRAIYAGVRRVQFADGRVVEYNTVDDMRKVLGDLNGQISAMSGTAPSSFTLATHSRD